MKLVARIKHKGNIICIMSMNLNKDTFQNMTFIIQYNKYPVYFSGTTSSTNINQIHFSH